MLMSLIIDLIFLTIIVSFYFIPSIVGYTRSHPYRLSILIINFFLGWTFFVWVLALAWALFPNKTQISSEPRR
jgi:hypothetical protein